MSIGGRPTDYSPELASRICAELAAGKSLKSVCDLKGMPSRNSIFTWLGKYPDFLEKYETAKQEAADLLAEEIIEIADDGRNDYMEVQQDGGGVAYKFNKEHVQRSRLRVDARKWIAAKLKPKKYGDKVTTELTGANGGPVQQITTIEIKAVDP
jgi:hypothetical protein